MDVPPGVFGEDFAHDRRALPGVECLEEADRHLRARNGLWIIWDDAANREWTLPHSVLHVQETTIILGFHREDVGGSYSYIGEKALPVALPGQGSSVRTRRDSGSPLSSSGGSSILGAVQSYQVSSRWSGPAGETFT